MTRQTLLFIAGVSLCLLALVLPSGALTMPFNATFPGERNINQWFEWKLYNASGLAGVVYHYTVYDARLMPNYSYHSESWNSWDVQEPTPGNQYLLIRICGWSEGTTWWGWGRDRFNVWVYGNTIPPEPVQLVDVLKVKRGLSWSMVLPPRTIAGLENVSAYPGFTWSGDVYGYQEGLEMNRMVPGKSNAWIGYLLYQVPAKANLSDIQVSGNFYNHRAYWNLEKKDYVQQNEEWKQEVSSILIVDQVLHGLRTSDHMTRSAG